MAATEERLAVIELDDAISLLELSTTEDTLAMLELLVSELLEIALLLVVVLCSLLIVAVLLDNGVVELDDSVGGVVVPPVQAETVIAAKANKPVLAS